MKIQAQETVHAAPLEKGLPSMHRAWVLSLHRLSLKGWTTAVIPALQRKRQEAQKFRVISSGIRKLKINLSYTCPWIKQT